MMLSPKFNWKEWVIVGVVLLVLAAIAIPNFVHARETKCLNSIGNNLRIIEGAKEQWAGENRKMRDDPVSLSELTAYFKGNKIPESAGGEVYSVTTVGALAQAVFPDNISPDGRRGPHTTTSY